MLRFSIKAIPVEVSLWFGVMGLVIGLPVLARFEATWWALPVWLLILFLSVLIHELGHALVASRMGASASIRLHAMGGVTSWSMDEPVRPGRRIVIALAGSAAGLVVGGLVWLLLLRTDLVPPPWSAPARLFVTANVFWGLLNWLPVRPLDGGHVVAATLELVFGRRGSTVADIAFPLLTIGIAVWAWSNGYPIGALLAAFALLAEVEHRRQRRRGERLEPSTRASGG